MRELIFLPLANHLPRLVLSDFLRYFFYKLAGIEIEGRCIIYGPFIILPLAVQRIYPLGKARS